MSCAIIRPPAVFDVSCGAPGDFYIVSAPAILLCSGTTFARNSDGLVTPPTIFKTAGAENWHKTIGIRQLDSNAKQHATA